MPTATAAKPKKKRATNKHGTNGAVAKKKATPKKKKTVKKPVKKTAVKKAVPKKAAPKPPGHGLTTPQKKILLAMGSTGKDMSYADIGIATGLKKGKVRAMASQSSKGNLYPKSLESLGYVRRFDAQGDGRQRFVWSLTSKGRALAKELKEFKA